MGARWKDQCEAAFRIRDDFGLEKALGYLIGEKFLALLDWSRTNIEGRLEVQDFADRIRQDWPVGELRSYLQNVERVGVQGHVLDAEAARFMEDCGAFAEGPADWAEHQLLLEQARRLLLPGG